ncbi:hypothetical protein OAL14_07615 [Gammaproteobacteria bacterium]|nr:hypothetical protein [Gammaproteobacteria bacterium]
MSDEKLDFAGSAWVDKATKVLEALVNEHGQEETSFSVCEVFTDAPADVSASGIAAWYFYIEGKSVRVGLGEEAGTDVRIQADYESSLPNVRLVYTPEVLEEMRENAEERTANTSSSVEGDMSKAPPYLVELHNQMAPLTA